MLKGVYPENLFSKTEEDIYCSIRQEIDQSYPILNSRRSSLNAEALQGRVNLRKPRLQLSPLETCTESRNETLPQRKLSDMSEQSLQ